MYEEKYLDVNMTIALLDFESASKTVQPIQMLLFFIINLRNDSISLSM